MSKSTYHDVSELPVHKESGLPIQPIEPWSGAGLSEVLQCAALRAAAYQGAVMRVEEHNDGIHVIWGSVKHGAPDRIIFISSSEAEVMCFLRGFIQALS